MIMKVRYIAVVLTSLGLAAAAASVPAQQELPTKRHGAGPFAFIGAEPQSSGRSADVFFNTSQSSYYGAPEYINPGSPQRTQLASQESVLAHEADQLKHNLESAQTDAQRSEIRTKLTENIGKQFDLRQKRHGLEIEALEAQVKKLKELVRKRQEGREEIISRRVDQTLREADGLGW
jgi:hypothetical protein